MTSSPASIGDPPRLGPWSYALGPLAAFALVVGLFEATSIDLELAERFYDRATGRWIWGQTFWANELIHDAGRYLIFLVGVTALAIWAVSFGVRRVRPLRRAAGFVVLTIGLATGTVAVLKRDTVVGCPWDLRLFGGERPYVRLFDQPPAGLERGGCFPGGHSSGGFSLLAFYFVLRERHRRRAWAALGVGLCTGLVFAFGQWARGAHFLSHDVWSAFICWYVALGLYALVFRGRLWGSATASGVPAAAARSGWAGLAARVLLVFLGTAASSPAAAEHRAALAREGTDCLERSAGIPTDDVLEAGHAVISQIDILVGDVFDLADPAEDSRLFSWANRLHRETRAEVIRSQLLIRRGDPYSGRLLEESGRLLRSRRYLDDVCVRPVRYHDHHIEIEVATRDVWTLGGGVSFGRKGGANSTSFEIHDTNFLGSGKDLTLRRSSNVDRSGILARYRDPSFTRLRADLELGYADNSDGSRAVLGLERPFFSLDTRWAGGVSALAGDRVDRLYFRGEVVDRFHHQQDRIELIGGLSSGLSSGHALRWIFGATYAHDRFLAAEGEVPPITLPADRRLVFPWIGMQYVEDAFAETSDLDQIHRTEDRYVGRRFGGRLGWSSPAFGADRSRLILSADFADSWQLPSGDLVEVSAALGGRWGRSAENLLLSTSARYYRRTFGRHLLFVRLDADMGSHLDLETPLYLGGQSGLRGYPLRYQAGDRRLLLTVEQRFFTDWQVLRLARVGAVAFLDVGRAWTTGGPGAPDDPGAGLLTDLGIGLRVSLSRSGNGSMIHLDVAVPLDGDPSKSGVQWLVSTHKTF